MGQIVLYFQTIRYLKLAGNGIGNRVAQALDEPAIDCCAVLGLQSSPHLQQKNDDGMVVFIFGEPRDGAGVITPNKQYNMGRPVSWQVGEDGVTGCNHDDGLIKVDLIEEN